MMSVVTARSATEASRQREATNSALLCNPAASPEERGHCLTGGQVELLADRGVSAIAAIVSGRRSLGGAREPDPSDARYRTDSPEQVREQGRASQHLLHPSFPAARPDRSSRPQHPPPGSQVATVGVHVLAEQRDLDRAARRKCLEFLDELTERPADLRPRTAGTMQKAQELLHPT